MRARARNFDEFNETPRNVDGHRSVVVLHGRPRRGLVTRDGPTERQSSGDRVLRRQLLVRHARHSRRRLGANHAEKVSYESSTRSDTGGGQLATVPAGFSKGYFGSAFI